MAGGSVGSDGFDTSTKRTAAFAAAVVVSMSALLCGAPASVADPYGDDDGGSSYSDGGSDGGGMDVGEPSGGGMDVGEPSGGGMHVDEPSGGGMDVNEPPGGGMDHGEPSGGGMDHGEPTGGGMDSGQSGGGMDTGQPGGGMDTGQSGGGMDTGQPGGGMHTGEPSGGGMHTGEPSGGGMHTGEPSGGGMSQAPPKDVATANSAAVVAATTSEATSEQVSSYESSIESIFTSSTYSNSTTLSSPVTSWNSKWISYDRFYRPVFTNPYPSPLQVVYDYGGRPQTFTVPPLQRAVVEAPKSGVYSFTGVTRPASGPPSTVSVGSFSGGGFKPAPGQAPPQKPTRPKGVKNALVRVSYASGKSEPFRVKLLDDLGNDAAMNGAQKVLLDGEIPAWGQWVKSVNGEQMFEITETQLMPGVKPPGQDPLPGYKIQLTASESSWFDRNKTLVVGVAAGSGLLALAAVALLLIRRRGGGEAESG
jgi:hypothetical protein